MVQQNHKYKLGIIKTNEAEYEKYEKQEMKQSIVCIFLLGV